MYRDDDVKAGLAWLRTLEMLSSDIGEGHARDQGSVDSERSIASTYRSGDNLQVRILEQPTNSTLIIHWRDPGRCFYGDQSWRLSKARIAGRCAFSRVAIRKGDDVYRPAYTGAEPQNAQAMILASAVYGV
ncbi:DUF3331 domain-containing protein [Paraburkholderia sp. SIMBA_049]